MNILSLIKNTCFNLYNCNFSYQKRGAYCQPKVIPEPVLRNMNFCQPNRQREIFCEFKVSAQSRNPLAFNPLKLCHPIPQTSQIDRQTDLLIQTLHTQISQLERENNLTLGSIAIRPSQHIPFNSISPLTTLSSSENVQKFAELSKLNAKLQKVSDFTNEEMIEVLHLVHEACEHLEERLKGLREKSPYIEEDDLLIENIEHTEVLEITLKALQQLEVKFQAMQKAHFAPASRPSQDKQSDNLSTLLEKIDQLNQEKRFLKECQAHLPMNRAYNIEELRMLMQSFSNERAELNQKIDVARQKFNKAKQFSNEITNHLLDYAELLKVNLQSIRRLCPNATSSKPVVTPLLNMTTHQMNLATRQAKIEVKQDEGINQDELMFAANEVALAIKQLMEVGQS